MKLPHSTRELLAKLLSSSIVTQLNQIHSPDATSAFRRQSIYWSVKFLKHLAKVLELDPRELLKIPFSTISRFNEQHRDFLEVEQFQSSNYWSSHSWNTHDTPMDSLQPDRNHFMNECEENLGLEIASIFIQVRHCSFIDLILILVCRCQVQ